MTKLLTVILGLLLYVGGASADSIGPDCDTCQGSIYTLTYSGDPLPETINDPSHQTFRITYTIDTSGYTGDGVAIDAASIKVSSSVFSASLFDAPGALSDWTLVAGGINAGGCSGDGGGFECADFTASTSGGAAVGGTLVWIFDITVDNGTLLTATGSSSIKARYVDETVCDPSKPQCNKVGDLVSEPITLQTDGSSDPTDGRVPEPSTLLLVGAGLIVMSKFARRVK